RYGGVQNLALYEGLLAAGSFRIDLRRGGVDLDGLLQFGFVIQGDGDFVHAGDKIELAGIHAGVARLRETQQDRARLGKVDLEAADRVGVVSRDLPLRIFAGDLDAGDGLRVFVHNLAAELNHRSLRGSEAARDATKSAEHANQAQ